MGSRDWGVGIRDWGLGKVRFTIDFIGPNGDWGFGSGDWAKKNLWEIFGRREIFDHGSAYGATHENLMRSEISQARLKRGVPISV